MHFVGASQIMHGDSGGPWVLRTENPWIVGVTSYNKDFKATSATTGYYQYHFAARVTAAAMHDWIRETAGIVRGVTNTIYRNPDTGESWLMKSDGFRHVIPDGGTYLCLTGRGYRVVNLDAFELAEIPLTKSSNARCVANQGAVLLYGDGNGVGSNGFTNLEGALTAAGFRVSSLAGQSSLPADLSGYGQIWHYGIDTPSAADQQALIAFAKSGRGLYLTGEWPCCEDENRADSNIINSLVVTVGGIGVGGLGEYFRPVCAANDQPGRERRGRRSPERTIDMEACVARANV